MRQEAPRRVPRPRMSFFLNHHPAPRTRSNCFLVQMAGILREGWTGDLSLKTSSCEFSITYLIVNQNGKQGECPRKTAVAKTATAKQARAPVPTWSVANHRPRVD
jgi:hypothetical protein